MNKHFKLGDFLFLLEYPDSICLPSNFITFEICEGTVPLGACYTFSLQIAEDLPQPMGTPVFSSDVLLVYQNGQLEERYIGSRLGEGYYACSRECGINRTEIVILTSAVQYLIYDTVFASLLSLERRLLEYDSLLLHCAYVEANGKALLFSAPSETGKTTQANLWEKYRDAKTVNGDRALLSCKGQKWYANGWPVCGSSGICNNKALPIQAIVMLSQAKENHVEKLRAAKAFSQLYSQITLNRWNPVAQDKAFSLIDSLLKELPIYHLSCNISEEAVNCLSEWLDA